MIYIHKPIKFKKEAQSIGARTKDKRIQYEKKVLKNLRKENNEIQDKLNLQKQEYESKEREHCEKYAELLQNRKKLQNKIFKMTVRKNQILSFENKQIINQSANVVTRYLKGFTYYMRLIWIQKMNGLKNYRRAKSVIANLQTIQAIVPQLNSIILIKKCNLWDYETPNQQVMISIKKKKQDQYMLQVYSVTQNYFYLFRKCDQRQIRQLLEGQSINGTHITENPLEKIVVLPKKTKKIFFLHEYLQENNKLIDICFRKYKLKIHLQKQRRKMLLFKTLTINNIFQSHYNVQGYQNLSLDVLIIVKDYEKVLQGIQKQKQQEIKRQAEQKQALQNNSSGENIQQSQNLNALNINNNPSLMKQTNGNNMSNQFSRTFNNAANHTMKNFTRNINNRWNTITSNTSTNNNNGLYKNQRNQKPKYLLLCQTIRSYDENFMFAIEDIQSLNQIEIIENKSENNWNQNSIENNKCNLISDSNNQNQAPEHYLFSPTKYSKSSKYKQKQRIEQIQVDDFIQYFRKNLMIRLKFNENETNLSNTQNILNIHNYKMLQQSNKIVIDDADFNNQLQNYERPHNLYPQYMFSRRILKVINFESKQNYPKIVRIQSFFKKMISRRRYQEYQDSAYKFKFAHSFMTNILLSVIIRNGKIIFFVECLFLSSQVSRKHNKCLEYPQKYWKLAQKMLEQKGREIIKHCLVWEIQDQIARKFKSVVEEYELQQKKILQQKPQKTLLKLRRLFMMAILKKKRRQNVYYVKKIDKSFGIVVLIVRKSNILKNMIQAQLHILKKKQQPPITDNTKSKHFLQNLIIQTGLLNPIMNKDNNKPQVKIVPQKKIYKNLCMSQRELKIFMHKIKCFKNLQDQFYISQDHFLLKPLQNTNYRFLERLGMVNVYGEQIQNQIALIQHTLKRQEIIYGRPKAKSKHQDNISMNLIKFTNSSQVSSFAPNKNSKIKTLNQEIGPSLNTGKVLALGSNVNFHEPYIATKKTISQAGTNNYLNFIQFMKNPQLGDNKSVFYSLYKDSKNIFHISLFIIEKNSSQEYFKQVSKQQLSKKQVTQSAWTLVHKIVAEWLTMKNRKEGNRRYISTSHYLPNNNNNSSYQSILPSITNIKNRYNPGLEDKSRKMSATIKKKNMHSYHPSYDGIKEVPNVLVSQFISFLENSDKSNQENTN